MLCQGSVGTWGGSFSSGGQDDNDAGGDYLTEGYRVLSVTTSGVDASMSGTPTDSWMLGWASFY